MALAVALAGPVAAPGGAGADPIEDKRNEARKVADELERLHEQADLAVEDFLAAQAALEAAQERVGAAEAVVRQADDRVAATEAALAAIRDRLRRSAVDAYVRQDAADPLLIVLEHTGPADVARSTYVKAALRADLTLTDRIVDAKEDADIAVAESTSAREALADERDALAGVAADLDQRRAEADERVAAHTKALAKVQGELAELVRAEEERRRAEEERLAREKAAREAAAREAARKAAAAKARASGGAATAGKEVPPPSPGAKGAIAAAMSQLGVPYRYAGSTPGVAFDCSGLTMWAWGQAGVDLPHSSRMQFASLPQVPVDQLQPGDLVFFGSPIHHVGMYIGNDQMVHAPHTGDVVKVVTVWRRDLVGAARPG